MTKRTTPHKFKVGDKVMVNFTVGISHNYGTHLRADNNPNTIHTIVKLGNHDGKDAVYDYHILTKEDELNYVDELCLIPLGELGRAIYE